MTPFRTGHSISYPGKQRPTPPERPCFNSQITSDRIKESSKFVPFTMSGKIRKGRKSIFREIGLEDDYRNFRRSVGVGGGPSCEKKKEEHREIVSPPPSEPKPTRETYRRSYTIGGESSRGKPRWLYKLLPEKRPTIKSASTAPPTSGGLHRFVLIALIIAVVLPAIGYTNSRRRTVEVSGADAGVIREPIVRSALVDRANSPTDVCKRWAGQSKH